MNMKMVTFAGALALVGCGGLQETPDLDGGPQGGAVEEGTGGTSYGVGGTGPVGGVSPETGGYATAGTGPHSGGEEAGGTGFDAGGRSTGGTGHGGAEQGGEGGHEAGGVGTGGAGFAGTPSGGYETGGGGPVGGAGGSGSIPPDRSTCLQSVVHCFDAAANCYEYSPSSDCDQIVDICAAMQQDCDASSR